MNIMLGIQTALWADAGFKAASPGGIMPVLLPENATLPATTYHIVGGSSDPTFDTSGMQRLRVQFDFHGADQAGVDAARTALIQALNGYRGLLSDGTFLQCAELVQPIDYFDNQPRQFRCSVEFYLVYTFNF